MTGRVVVTGFHRSGTSATARLLHRAGVHLGDELVGARRSNPFGHFEDRRIVDFHDGVLDRMGLDWHVEEAIEPTVSEDDRGWMEAHAAANDGRHRVWGFKDPRACFFLDAWRAVLEDVVVVGVFRDPVSAVRSLHRREARRLRSSRRDEASHRRFFVEPGLGVRMWLASNRSLLAFVQAHPERSILVSFEALGRGEPLTRVLRDRFDLPIEPVPTHDAIEPHHSVPRIASLSGAGDLVDEARSLHDDLVTMATPALGVGRV